MPTEYESRSSFFLRKNGLFVALYVGVLIYVDVPVVLAGGLGIAILGALYWWTRHFRYEVREDAVVLHRPFIGDKVLQLSDVDSVTVTRSSITGPYVLLKGEGGRFRNRLAAVPTDPGAFAADVEFHLPGEV